MDHEGPCALHGGNHLYLDTHHEVTDTLHDCDGHGPAGLGHHSAAQTAFAEAEVAPGWALACGPGKDMGSACSGSSQEIVGCVYGRPDRMSGLRHGRQGQLLHPAGADGQMA